MPYTPRPIDTSRVELPPAIASLIEELARNNHEVWALGRMQEGWTWGTRRDDVAKKHPQLVPYEELPESEKQYDRNAAVESLKTVLRFGWAVEPAVARDGQGPAAPEHDQPTDVPADALGMLAVWRGHDPEGWARRPEPYRALAAGLRRCGEPLVAYDVLVEGLGRWPADVRLRQLQATVLADLGCPLEAMRVVEPLRDEPDDPTAPLEETLGVLGRIYKDLALRSGADRRVWLGKARDAYAEAFRRTSGYWTGINAATLALLGGKVRVARALADQVADQCRARLASESRPSERYWLLATLGEAALVRARHEEARDWYARAVAVTPADYRSIASSRRNARLVATALRLPWDAVAASLPLPTVVVFAGHMIDRADRRQPRFPPALEPQVAYALAERLDRIGPAICYSSAACGSDLLFLEAALARRQEIVVVLPHQPDGFRADSVEIVPGEWGPRFDAVIARAQVVPPVSNQRATFGSAYYDFANKVLLGLATLRARQLATRLVGLAVWDGRPGDGPGGTAATLALWNEHGIAWDSIDLDAIRRGTATRVRAPRPPRHAARRRDDALVRAILFADVRNFSKLPEEVARPFVTHVLGLAGRLARRRAMAPVGREPRGDGFYLVFAAARAAGRFALALSEGLARTNWAARGLPSDLVMRIGLHAGVVYRVRDPMTGRRVHVGTHVNRAARIEPVTPPGQVWASQEFAALAALEEAREFSCEYVGQVPLAKGYGVFPLYRLRTDAFRLA